MNPRTYCRKYTLAAGSNLSCRRRQTAVAQPAAVKTGACKAHAQPNWSANWSLFAASDQLDEAARRLRIKANQLAKKGPLTTEQSASLAAQRMQIELQDALAAALQQMQTETAQEQYEEAARLRDEALAWLEGWHKPANTANTSVSSLLFVRKEHSRWTGR